MRSVKSRYETVAVFSSSLGIMVGLKPIVTKRTWRWKWQAWIHAKLNTYANPLGISYCDVKKAKPNLILISGGKYNA